MPLFFLLAGAGSRFALNIRSGGRYVWERFKRLIIPFVFGAFVFTPPQVYMEWITHSGFRGSYFEFYPQFFTSRFKMFGLSFGWLFGSFGYHLWFLGFLFVFSVLALPLFRFFRRDAGQRLISSLATFSEKRGAIFLWVIPIAAVQMALRARFPRYLDLADLLLDFDFHLWLSHLFG